jgi:hypothetical protein
MLATASNGVSSTLFSSGTGTGSSIVSGCVLELVVFFFVILSLVDSGKWLVISE